MKSLIYAGLALGLLGSTCALAQPAPAPAERHAPDPASRLSPGDRVPDDYQQDAYVVTAWEDYDLQSPPHGYRWLRNDRGGQYLLTSQATGQIADTVNQAMPKPPHGSAADAGPPAMQWTRGDRLSGRYLDSRFTVADWHGAGLSRPARGYHWVNIDGHYMLTSTRTGAIRDIRDAR